VVHPATGFYVDSNVLLRVGQPRLGWLYIESLSFLQRNSGHLVIGPVVIDEVDYQLRARHGEYQDIRAVRHWLYRECRMLDLGDGDRRLIEELAEGYRAHGWEHEFGDRGDRLHAATAAVSGTPFLATWEKRFLGQFELIRNVNRTHGVLITPRLVRPDHA